MARTKKAAPRSRRRRSAADARELILDHAEALLSKSGPDALRLQELAREIGVSHPTILHHFGSREGLVEAVVRRAFEALHRDLLAAMGEDLGHEKVESLVERVYETLGQRGHARLLAWLLLSGAADPAKAGQQLRLVAQAAHARRLAELPAAAKRPELEDTVFSLLTLALALFGDAVAGDGLRVSAGLARDKKTERRYRAWLTRLVIDHLERG